MWFRLCAGGLSAIVSIGCLVVAYMFDDLVVQLFGVCWVPLLITTITDSEAFKDEASLGGHHGCV